MNKDLTAVFDYMEREKGIDRSVVIHAIEESLQVAAQKSIKGAANVSVNIDPRSGAIEVLCEKEIVQTVDSPTKQISLDDARTLDPDCQLGQFIDIVVTPRDFGRIAAQKARQIISQRLRMAERDVIYEEYRHRVGEIISGGVKRIGRGKLVIVDLGKVDGLLPMRNYPRGEHYQVGDRVTALLEGVHDTEQGGAEVILSRSSPDFVRQLMQTEVPELQDGSVTIEKIVRDGGYRTKMLVRSSDPKVDPVGACVGIRGVRVKNVIRELNNEKIDIIPFAGDPIDQLQNALSPIEIRKISLNEDEHIISIIVDDDDFAIALGRRGMNARLNGELIGYDLEVQKMSDYFRTIDLYRREMADSEDKALDQEVSVLERINPLIVENLVQAEIRTLRDVVKHAPDELIAKVPGLTLEMTHNLIEQIQQQRT